MLAPFFGSLNIPIYFRVGAAVSIAVVLFPVVDGNQVITAPPTVIMYGISVLAELFIGWLIGFVAYISFAAITMAGKVMDMQVGFAIVNVMDPTSGQQMPLIGSFLYNLSLIIFVVTNGHHVLLTALTESFNLVPILAINPNLSLTMLIANFTTGIFLTGMKIAMPVTFAILLTNVSLGILARTMPQLNIFVVGLPLQLTIGMLTLTMVVPFFIIYLGGMFDEMYAHILSALRMLQ